MGFRNPRAFCPNCGAKIHTHREYKGRLIRGWAGPDGFQATGKECPECGVALTGSIGAWSNKAELAEPGQGNAPR
jgi:hypothetical protein